MSGWNAKTIVALGAVLIGLTASIWRGAPAKTEAEMGYVIAQLPLFAIVTGVSWLGLTVVRLVWEMRTKLHD